MLEFLVIASFSLFSYLGGMTIATLWDKNRFVAVLLSFIWVAMFIPYLDFLNII